MSNRTQKILVVEDARDIAQMVQLHLREDGYEVETTHDGLVASEKIAAHSYDLILLDLMLPGLDGLELCRRIRAQSPYTLVLMLTSKDTELDRVLGLEMGADDYLTKPFSLRELGARVKALFRRAAALSGNEKASSPCPEAKNDDNDMIRSGELRIEIEKRKVLLDGSEVNLTAKEFDLLYLFACHPGRVYTRVQLLDTLWGYGYEGYEHTVNSHINRLRAKIEKDPAQPRYLLTVWGVGYKFADTN